MAEISERLLAQRLRNRIMEVLSIYSTDEDWEYLGPDEVMNQWEDFVDEIRMPLYIEPVFTKQEQDNLRAFHNFWTEYCNSTPKNMPPFKEIKATSEWQSLKTEAQKLLEIFELRGSLNEEVEIT